MKWTTEDTGAGDPFAYPTGSTNAPHASPHWRILNSMRSVDQDANMKAFPMLAPPTAAPSNIIIPPTPTDEPEEI
jgi:hypothetical protein